MFPDLLVGTGSSFLGSLVCWSDSRCWKLLCFLVEILGASGFSTGNGFLWYFLDIISCVSWGGEGCTVQTVKVRYECFSSEIKVRCHVVIFFSVVNLFGSVFSVAFGMNAT